METKYYLVAFNVMVNGRCGTLETTQAVTDENPRFNVVKSVRDLMNVGFEKPILFNVWESTKNEYEEYNELKGLAPLQEKKE